MVLIAFFQSIECDASRNSSANTYAQMHYMCRVATSIGVFYSNAIRRYIELVLRVLRKMKGNRDASSIKFDRAHASSWYTHTAFRPQPQHIHANKIESHFTIVHEGKKCMEIKTHAHPEHTFQYFQLYTASSSSTTSSLIALSPRVSVDY